VLLTNVVNDSVTAAAVIADRTPPTLSETAKRLYTALVATAVETARGRGYSPTVTHVSLHMPLIILADVCGIHRVTAWRHLPALRQLGLVDYVNHKGTLRGETRNTGTLFEVRLNPTSGTKAKLSYHEKKHKWRDLDKDVRRKRTAFRMLKARDATISKTSTKELDISRLLEWTLKPDTSQTPLVPYSCKPNNPVLEALLDVSSGRRGQDTVQRVDTAAQALATALADHSSVNFYRRLVWRLLKASEKGTDYFPMVYQMAVRARVDVQENFSRRGGAVFCSRLKDTAFWDEVMKT
jgi:hypothetical protein